VYVEVKHVTLSPELGEGSFPDAVTTRGQKHLRELIQQVKAGQSCGFAIYNHAH